MRPLPTILAFVFLLGVGCEQQVDAALLHVESLDAEGLEPGAMVRVTGRGFPPGHAGTLRFEGIAHRPGEPPLAVRTEVMARAESDARLGFECSPDMVHSLGGRGTFVGRVRAEFAGADGAVVFGELAPVTLSIRPGGLGEITGVLSRERRGAELLGHLGITLRDGDDAESGLIVESFPPGSLADLSGVHKGDRIVALGPMRVDEVSDVIPPPTARSVELVIERPGLTQPIRAVVSLSPTVSGPDQRAVYGATFAVGLAVLLLLLVSPAARVTAKVFRALSTPSPSSLLSLVPASAPGEPSARSRLVRMIWVAVAFSAVVLAFGVLPFVTRMLPGTIDVAVLAAACVTLSAGVEAARRRVVGGRGYAVLRAVFLGVPAVAAVAAVALPLGSFRLEMFSAAQGGEPWAWLGLSSLPGLLGLPAAVISLLLVPASTTMGTTALVLDRQRIFVGASLLSIVFLGGFRLPFVAGDPLLSTPAIRVAAALAFVAKALIVVVIASRLRSAALSSRALAWVSYISASLAVGAALLVSMLPFLTPPPWAVGPVAVVVVSTIALVALVRARRADAAPAPRGLLLFS